MKVNNCLYTVSLYLWLSSKTIELPSWSDTFRKENKHMPIIMFYILSKIYTNHLAKKLSLSLLIMWKHPQGSYEQKLHSYVFVTQLFYYHQIFHSTLILGSLQMKSSLAWRWLSTSLLFCRLCTSAVSLMPPLDPSRPWSLYSCGWKPTPQTTPPVRYSIRPWYILMLFSGHLTSLCRRAKGWRKTVNHRVVERAGAITDRHMDFRWGKSSPWTGPYLGNDTGICRCVDRRVSPLTPTQHALTGLPL